MHLWSLDIRSPLQLTCQDLIDAQRLTAVSITHLIQEAIDHEWLDQEDRLRLMLVTAGAQQVYRGMSEESSGLQPGQGSLIGMARVVCNELPQLRCQIIDLDVDCSDVSPILNELRVDDGEPELAWRDGQRFVSRITGQRGDLMAPILRARRSYEDERPFGLHMPAPGGFERLILKEIAARDPGDDEILVDVRTAGINFRDIMAALGLLADDAEESPAWEALGLECAGKVAAVGRSVETLDVGDEVLVSARGAFSSRLTVAATQAIRMPADLSYEEAATISVAFSTAYLSLLHFGQISSGDTVLVHAGVSQQTRVTEALGRAKADSFEGLVDGARAGDGNTAVVDIVDDQRRARARGEVGLQVEVGEPNFEP